MLRTHRRVDAEHQRPREPLLIDGVSTATDLTTVSMNRIMVGFSRNFAFRSASEIEARGTLRD